METLVRLGCRLLAAIVGGAIAVSPSLAGGERVALLIGNGAYSETTQLRNPPNDVADMGRALERLGFEVLLLVDGDKLTIERGIRAFGELLTGAEVGLFFYAGHGLQVNGRNYIVPTNARLVHERDLLFEAIDVGLPISVMEQSGVRMSLVILDACRDNPLARTLAGSIRSTGRSTKVSRGLASIEGARGTLIAYAAAPGDIAADGDGRNSPFTAALLRWIDQPRLEVGLMFRRIRESVIAATNGQQVPWVNEALVGEFYFADAPPAAAVSSAPAGTQKAALPPPEPPPATAAPEPRTVPERDQPPTSPDDGQWVGDAKTSFGACSSYEVEMTLAGNSLRGSAKTGGEYYTVTGKVQDDRTITFFVSGGQGAARGKGKITGTEAKGNWDDGGECSGTFRLKKVS